jgi:hypothetical protein
VFTIRRNSRSQSTGTGVHDRPDSAFTIHRNTHFDFPVFMTVPNSGHSLATIATARDPSDADWQRASEIVCRIIAQKVGCDRLRARELTCTVANGTVAAADVISD